MVPPPTTRDAAFLLFEGITKRFGGLTALDDVGFEMASGEVHAIVGENGAGKSTLMKILAGVERPDAGRILFRGDPLSLSGPLEARKLGISIVFQELNLFPHLTVAGNIFANRERTTLLGFLDERAMVDESRAVLESMGVGMDPRARVSSLSVGEKQLVEIARTLEGRSSLIRSEEHTSALTGRESERLFEIIRRLRSGGATILYVSHRLEEVFAIADRITVLRDGRYQGTWRVSETDIPRIVRAMIGSKLEEAFPARRPIPASSPILLEAGGLRKDERLGPVSFALRSGEILGVAGLEGSGVETLFRVLFGLEEPTAGEVLIEGRLAPLRSPGEARRRGVGLIPRSR